MPPTKCKSLATDLSTIIRSIGCAELARRTGFNEPKLSRIANGIIGCSVEDADLILAAAGVAVLLDRSKMIVKPPRFRGARKEPANVRLSKDPRKRRVRWEGSRP